jgi:BA14K-like protein
MGLKLLFAVAGLSMAIATPVFAQAAIQEPGAYAFYHPNGDVLEANRPWPRQPSGSSMAFAPGGAANAYAYMGAGANASCQQRYRSYDPASGTFLGFDGQRHPCP